MITPANSITKTREQLKEKFVTGAVPTQQDFHDLLDAYVHKSDESLSLLPTPFEQFLIAYYPSYHSTNGGNGWNEYNVGRLPMFVDGGGPSYDMATHFFDRKILYYRGRFYDNNQPGEVLHAFASLQFGSTTNILFEVWIDSLHHNFYINPDSYATEDEANSIWIIDSDRTVTADGYSYIFSIDNSNNVVAVEIVGSQQTIGTHSLSAQFNGNMLSLFGDEEQTTPPQYGSDDAHGYYVANHSASANARMFFKLTDLPNPSTASLGWYAYECYYCDESELEPGTYYTPDNDNSNGTIDGWLHEVVIPENQ